MLVIDLEMVGDYGEASSFLRRDPTTPILDELRLRHIYVYFGFYITTNLSRHDDTGLVNQRTWPVPTLTRRQSR